MTIFFKSSQLRSFVTVALEVASERGPLAHFISGGFVIITESASKFRVQTNTQKRFACPDMTRPNKLHMTYTNIKRLTFNVKHLTLWMPEAIPSAL